MTTKLLLQTILKGVLTQKQKIQVTKKIQEKINPTRQIN
jgi:hypothetical protein